MEIFREVGLPPGVLQLSARPRRGRRRGAGRASRRGADRLHRLAAGGPGDQSPARPRFRRRALPYVKRVIAEMGGKNAIIVDDDADLDEAVLGVVKSAFGYQGQKCSACSRAIVLDAVYDAFLERLVEATRSLKVGPAEDPATSVGPVIDERVARADQAVHRDRPQEGARGAGGRRRATWPKQGYYVGPHIFADVPPNSRLAQEEIFGPVLAVIRADGS